MTTQDSRHSVRNAAVVPDELNEVECTVNGARARFSVPPHRTLMDALRYQLDLTGTKTCCAEGECGACTVLVDGVGVNSCLMLAAEADGSTITTVEGLGLDTPSGLSDLQESFLEAGAVQCGFCIPGQVVAAEYLLRGNPSPTVEEIREGMSGNLCRCAGYQRIVAAVQMTARKRSHHD
ncbi:(2Fe-2S)-binding protein [Nocardioides litoris]|uniref:(2Fe-2S)-binding protein n=1 Tax=Nocardioides litoris TaxID=1926648 RepID=UPI001FEC1C89|nr:(2Fe-2S)-binding protein [Nocardioides litoris]